MKRIISLLLALVITISTTTTSFAANTGEEYYTVQVEYSDNIGHQEGLDVMILNNNVFVDAKMLAERLGYTFGENGEGAVIYNKDTSNGLPFGITQFKYNSTQVSHMLFNNMIDTYEAPFASVKNSEGSWIPLEYSLLLINSGMMITDDALLIDIPTKRIIDYFYNIAKNSEKYNFDWADDFGYTETDLKVLGGSSHLINVFNGLLGFDGASWATLFQQFAGSMASYDKKYGENLAMLLCTESDKELQASIEKVELLTDLLDVDGDLGKLLSFTSDMADFEVGTLYRQCEAVLEGIKTGNSSAVDYSRSYQALENALDRQTWFSNTGGNILEVQKGVSSAAGKAFTFLEVGTKVLEVVGYAQEFQNQDKFSLAALMYYLENANGGLELPEAMKKSMIDHSDTLSGSIGGYMEKRFLENVDQWLVDAVKDEVPLHKIFGSQAAAILIVWDIASNTIPFIANGLSGADSFELALYSLVFQGDTYLNYLGKRDSVFADAGNITAENVYDIAQYCYIYLKSCYTTREAALASLVNKSSSTKEKIQPLIDYQNSINAEIAKIMVELKGANRTNNGCVFGFLPSDNEAYMGKYDDSQLISWIKEPKKIVEKIELTNDVYYDEAQGMAYEYTTITAYSDTEDIVWSYETPKFIATEMTAVVELGQKGNYYYFVEDTSVVCIDVQSGTILWKNADYAGRASGFAFGESAIYLCGQYGPDFYAISYTGETLVRIDQFDPNYYWATEIELQEERAAVYLHGGTSDYDDPKIFYVDLNTYIVASELDKIATDLLSIDELSRLLNDYFATYQWENEDILSGSVFNGFWLNDTEALFELRVQTKSAEWTHQANILVGTVSIDARSLTGYIEWNGGTKVNINLQIRQDADISEETMDAQVNAINNNSYIEQYKAILLQHPESTPFSWGSNTIYIDTEYTLYDVDKNGMPELIVKEDMSKYYIYSFNGMDVISSDVCYWSYDECLYEYEGNGIVIHDGGMGSMRIENASLYSMVNNKLVWSEGLMSTEECSFDELYSFLDSLTPINDFLPITDYSNLFN